MSKEIEYTKICFVVMPFGEKKVGKKKVNFDWIYDTIFEPAVKAVVMPGGENLIPKRTDKDYFSASIDNEMFSYLHYSRIVLTDISGLNANVFYELGVRHTSNQSGTVILRQEKKPPPFDISHIKAFPYEYDPVEEIEKSKTFITKVLTDSLEYNRIDSPVQVALQAQKSQGPKVEQLIQDATNAMRVNDVNKAINKYEQALKQDPGNPLTTFDLGLLFKNQGKWDKANVLFKKAVALSPDYSEAWRELGVAENKIYSKAEDKSNIPSGEESLKKAIELNDQDFDALASLGGIYKRKQQFKESAEMYKRSQEVSNGHPYPLLNGLILQVKTEGLSSITSKQKFYMEKAEIPLCKQVEDDPPYNAPWSFFDLSTILLFQGKKEDSLRILKKGLLSISEESQIKTHYDTLMLIQNEKQNIPGYEDVLNALGELLN